MSVQLTTEQRVWVCLEMAKFENAPFVRRKFRQAFPNRRPPALSTIRKNFAKYKSKGTSLNQNKGNSGRPRTATSDANIALARQALLQDGVVSTRRNPLGISGASFSRITNSIKFHPYKMIKRQKLTTLDPSKRLEFCRWFIRMSTNDPSFQNNLITSDEAIFSMNGEVNTHNVIR